MLLIISVASSFSYLFYTPTYNFQASKDFPIKRVTNNGVVIFVCQNFEQTYKDKIIDIERQAEKDYLSYLDQQCDNQMYLKNNYLQQARWYGNSAYGNKLREKANSINTDVCNQYRELADKLKRSGRRNYW